jgi:adenylate cyclase class 2
MVLRLRDALETVLTFKGPPDVENTQHRSRPEYEVTVSDYDSMFRILTALGYTPAWRYEKYRESLQLGDVVLSLDHTPIGDFVEIEGRPDAIRPTAERLGLDWETRNLQTYREVFDAMRSADQVDMLFEER